MNPIVYINIYHSVKKVAVALCIAVFGFVQGVLAQFEQPEQTPQTITQSAYEAAIEGESRIPNSDIQSYTNNGGQYASSELSRAFDGNINTHWETGNPNTASFKNTVTVTFVADQTVARIDFTPRQDGAPGKGSPTQYKLHYSTATSGENFVLLKEGSFPGTFTNTVTINFNATEMRRFRFEFVECSQDWAAIAELRFFKESVGSSEVDAILLNIFTDKSYSALKPEVNASTIDEQIIVANSSLTGVINDKVVEILEEAKRLLDDPDVFERLTFTLSQKGRRSEERARTDMQLELLSLDATGFYVRPGETISIYLDVADDDPTPSLFLMQIGKIRGNQGTYGTQGFRRTYDLKPGINVITAPVWGSAGGTENSDFGPSAILFDNDNAPSHQMHAPVVRIVGGVRFPLYVHGKTDPAAFREEVNAYVTNIVTDANEASEFNKTSDFSNKYYNIAASVSENIVIHTSASGMQAALNGNPSGITMRETMERWEYVYKEFNLFSGYDITDPSSPDYRPRGKYVLVTLEIAAANGYAMNYTAYRGNSSAANKQTAAVYRQIVAYNTFAEDMNYLFSHEIGHQYEANATKWPERTNRIYTIYIDDLFGISPNIADRTVASPTGYSWISEYHKNHTTDPQGVWPSRDKNSSAAETMNAAIMYQMLLTYGMDIYGKANRYIYHHPSLFAGMTNWWEKMACGMSLVIGLDITEHLDYYTWTTSASSKAQTGVDKLPKSTRKSWYAYGPNMRTAGSSGFTQAGVDVTRIGKTLDVINASANEVLCYEIVRDGDVVGVVYPTNGQTEVTFATLQEHDEVTVFDRMCRPHTNYGSSVTRVPAVEDGTPLQAWVQDGVLYIKGLTAGQSYRIYTIVGTLAYQGVAVADMVKVENFRSLPSGAYIIHAGNQSVKLVW